MADFRCGMSGRVDNFFTDECPRFVEARYCSVWILPNPDDRQQVWGFYTLSASILARGAAVNRDQKRVPKGLPIPMALLGFMGSDARAPRGLGQSLIVDAARRMQATQDLPVWGIMLDSEGGPENDKLWEWYKARGFVPAVLEEDERRKRPGLMYAPLRILLAGT